MEADVDLTLMEGAMVMQALRKIAKGAGAYKHDPMEHAIEVISEQVLIAAHTFKEITGEFPPDICPIITDLELETYTLELKEG